MIFVLHGDLGDQIVMLPAVVAYHAMSERGIGGECAAYVLADRRVRALVPAYAWLRDERELPVQGSSHFVVSLNVWKACERFGKTKHPTQMFCEYAGLDDPGEVMRPEVVFDGDAQAYDYVVAPCANDPARSMRAETFRDLLGRLALLGSVAVLGIGDGAAEVGAPLSVDFLSDYPLPYVAGLLRNARRAVITVDSMPSRLAHAVGVRRRHVLLCADVVPREWAEYPGVRMVYGPPDAWSVDAVMGLVVAA